MDWDKSKRTAQVPFFYSLTSTFIFKVNFLVFFLFYEYLPNGERANITIAVG